MTSSEPAFFWVFTSQPLYSFAYRHPKIGRMRVFLNDEFWESVWCWCIQSVDLDTWWSVDIFSSQTFSSKKTYQIGGALWLDGLVNRAFWLASENLKGWVLMTSSYKASWCRYGYYISPTILLPMNRALYILHHRMTDMRLKLLLLNENCQSKRIHNAGCAVKFCIL